MDTFDSYLEMQYEDRNGTDLYDSDDEPFFDEDDEDDEMDDFDPDTTTRADWNNEDFPHLVTAGSTLSSHYPY